MVSTFWSHLEVVSNSPLSRAYAFISPAPLRASPFLPHRCTSATTSRRPRSQPHAAMSSPPSSARTPHSRPDDLDSTVITTTSATPAPPNLPSAPSSSQHDPQYEPLPNKWAVVTAASLVHALHATAVYMGPSTLLSPMRASLNLSVAQITLPLNVYRAVQAIFLIPAGFALDAIGPQRSLRVAITAAALLAPLLPFVSTLPHLIILQSLFSVTKLFGGLSALLLVTSTAFAGSEGIGTATGILLSGYSFAGFLAPAVIGSLSSHFGWRGAFGVLSGLFIVVALPLTFHFLREPRLVSATAKVSAWHRFRHKFRNALRKPVGIFDGSAPGAEAVLESRPLRASDSSIPSFRSGSLESSNLSRSSRDVRCPEISLQSPDQPASQTLIDDCAEDKPHNNDSLSATAEVKTILADKPDEDPLFTAPFLTVATAVAAFSFTMNIIFDHLLVFLNEDVGIPFNTATFYMSALNLVALFSKLSVGPIADRANKALLIAFFSVVGCTASLLLLDVSGMAVVVTTSLQKCQAFVILYGIAYAAVFNLTTAILPEFGNAKLGLRSNFNLMVLFSFGSVGSLASGFLRSSSGSYKWPFVLNVIAFAIAALAGLVKFFFYDSRGGNKLPSTADLSEKVGVLKNS